MANASASDIDRPAIRHKMELAMGPLPGDDRKVPLDVHILEEVKLDKYARFKLTYAAEKNDRVPAFLLIPHEPKRKLPAVLCLHQTTAIGKNEPVGLGPKSNLHYAVHLAERGYVTLAPDYPSFGDNAYDFKKSGYASGSMKAVWNNLRAVDLLVSRSEVDPKRIGVIGHSLGGHNAMFTAAFDDRISVIVSNCGFTSFAKYYNGNLKGWTSDRYMPLIATKYDLDPKKVPFDFTDVVTAFAPRPFLASAPLHDSNFEVGGVRDVIAGVKPVYERLGAADRLQANYPDCGHDFPPEVRKVAYEFLDRWLKEK
ncbi:MAG: alpha/beta hydrolase family protein [Gemmataceae bacterium]